MSKLSKYFGEISRNKIFKHFKQLNLNLSQQQKMKKKKNREKTRLATFSCQFPLSMLNAADNNNAWHGMLKYIGQ